VDDEDEDEDEDDVVVLVVVVLALDDDVGELVAPVEDSVGSVVVGTAGAEVGATVGVRSDVPADTCSRWSVVGAAEEAGAGWSADDRRVTSVRGARDEEGDTPRGTA